MAEEIDYSVPLLVTFLFSPPVSSSPARGLSLIFCRAPPHSVPCPLLVTVPRKKEMRSAPLLLVIRCSSPLSEVICLIFPSLSGSLPSLPKHGLLSLAPLSSRRGVFPSSTPSNQCGWPGSSPPDTANIKAHCPTTGATDNGGRFFPSSKVFRWSLITGETIIFLLPLYFLRHQQD